MNEWIKRHRHGWELKWLIRLYEKRKSELNLGTELIARVSAFHYKREFRNESCTYSILYVYCIRGWYIDGASRRVFCSFAFLSLTLWICLHSILIVPWSMVWQISSLNFTRTVWEHRCLTLSDRYRSIRLLAFQNFPPRSSSPISSWSEGKVLTSKKTYTYGRFNGEK